MEIQYNGWALTAQHLKNINEMPFRILQSAQETRTFKKQSAKNKWNFYH